MPPSEATAVAEPGYWAWVPTAFSALRHRNYRLYWLGQVVSMIGTWMQRTAQGWLVTDLVLELVSGARVEGLTNWYVALVTAMGTLPVLLLGPFTGVIADYLDKRRVLIVTQTLMAAQAALLALMAYLQILNIPWLIVLALFLGIVTAVDIPARQGMAIELVGREHLPNAIALNSGVFNTARVIGPAITGVMLALHFSVADAFLLNAVSYVAVIFALVVMRGDFAPRAHADGQRRETYWSRTYAGVSFLLTARGVRRIVVMVGVLALLVTPFVALLPAIARYRLSAGPAQFGFLATSFGAGAVVGSLVLAYLSGRQLQYLTLRIGYVLLLGGVIVVSQLRSLPAAYITLALTGFGFNWTFADSNTILQLYVPDELRGRVMGVYSMLFVGLYPVGTLLMGWAATNLGVSTALLAGTLISCAVALVLFVRHPRTNATL